jgi:hypothetical protein
MAKIAGWLNKGLLTAGWRLRLSRLPFSNCAIYENNYLYRQTLMCTLFTQECSGDYCRWDECYGVFGSGGYAIYCVNPTYCSSYAVNGCYNFE